MPHIDRDALDDPSLAEYLSSDSDTDVEPEDPERQRELETLEAPIPFDANFPRTVIVAGLPQTTEDKFEKLEAAVMRKVQGLLLERGLTTPEQLEKGSIFELEIVKTKDGNGKPVTAGVAFITFEDEFVAKQACKLLSSAGMGSQHPFRPCMLDDFDYTVQCGGADDEQSNAAAGQIGFYRFEERDWLQDPLCREQYAVRCDASTRLYWHDATTRSAELALPYEERLGLAVAWSPQGSYLATFHRKGIWLRSGPKFDKCVRFNHDKVRRLMFSPNEEFILTWDGSSSQGGNERAVIIWEVLTGKPVRAFPTPPRAVDGSDTDLGGWPFFIFSHDSKYLAMRRDKDIVVYELPSMTVLEEPGGTGRKKPLPYPLEQMSWSPTSNRLAVWIPESGDSPGRLVLVDIPSRQEIASKNVFNVRQLSMHWQENGHFLALRSVITRKKSKKTKTETTQLEILRVTHRNVPVDTVSLEESQARLLAWERGPNACRLAVLVVDAANQHTVNFYRVPPLSAAKKDTELVASYPVPAIINAIEWSPNGSYFVLASKSTDGTLLFGHLTAENKLEFTHRDDHQDLTDILWDSSGRYVATCCLASARESAYRYTANAGYRIWSFLGGLQASVANEGSAQFLWRPRPPLMLSPAEQEDIQRRLRDYAKRFQSEEEQRRAVHKASRKAEAGKRQNEFWSKVLKAQDAYVNDPSYEVWQTYQAMYDEIMDWEETVETWEEVISVERQKVVCA